MTVSRKTGYAEFLWSRFLSDEAVDSILICLRCADGQDSILIEGGTSVDDGFVVLQGGLGQDMCSPWTLLHTIHNGSKISSVCQYRHDVNAQNIHIANITSFGLQASVTELWRRRTYWVGLVLISFGCLRPGILLIFLQKLLLESF